MTQDDTIEGREIADLLPFYANGTLRGHEKARVAVALASDPALQRELALIGEEQDAAFSANESVAGPSRQAQDRFFALLDAQPKTAARFDLAGWVSAKLEALQPRTLAWAACGLALVVAVQAGWIGTLVMAPKGGSPAVFETASVPTAVAPIGTLVVVSFAPGATAKDLDKLLTDNGASIVAGPLPGGLYKVRISKTMLSSDTTGKIVAKLKAQTGLVRFAAPADAD